MQPATTRPETPPLMPLVTRRNYHPVTSLDYTRLRPASRWKRARSTGIEAARMVMAPSAVPKMKRFTVVTVGASAASPL